MVVPACPTSLISPFASRSSSILDVSSLSERFSRLILLPDKALIIIRRLLILLDAGSFGLALIDCPGFVILVNIMSIYASKISIFVKAKRNAS